LLEWARKVGPIDCVFDCGSRDAIDGLALLDQLGARELHAFECNPRALALCQRNIECSPHSAKVQLVACAVAERPGTLSFYPIVPERTVTPHADGNIGASSLYQANPKYPHEHYVQEKIEVSAISLDAYCRTHTQPDLLWMDLQGAEARALDGAQAVLPKVKVIHVEVSFRRMYLEQALFRDIHSRLCERFRLVETDLGRWPRWPHLYSFLHFGPWVGNAIYVNRALLD
jgi:FkbM family methyltransferase